MTEMEKLRNRLVDMGATNIGLTLGETATTQEELASEINKALDQIEAGDYDELNEGD